MRGRLTPSSRYDAYKKFLGTTYTYTYDTKNNPNSVLLSDGNSFGNIDMVSHNGAVVAKYRANSRGDINHIEDIVNELHHRATYDTTGRLIYTDTRDDSNQWLRTTSYDYDLRNNLTKFSFIDANGTNNTVTYAYNRSNQPWYAVLESGLTHRYFYDSLERVSRVKLYTETPIETTYTYVPSAASLETLTTTLISTEVSNAFAYSYYYDANGNITAILNGTRQSDGSYTYSDSTGNTYTYDQYNQLITDLNKDNATSTHYQYDTNGNITKKIVNSWNVAGNFPMGNLTTDYYTYGDTLGWGDLLTQYNGQTITYDEIGNPINYRNGMTMSWQAGRQLESITQNGKTYSFTYAHDGLRTKKSITSGNTTVDVNYVYEGDKLLQMTYDNYVLTFSYDANGIPVSFHVKNATLDKDYYYGTNSRGDIEVIYNADGTLHARYDYDAYGKILGVTAPDGTNITAPYAIANLNPLRYRGYVYDNETGLYYLQSRYYDPVTCRFINADAYMSTGQGITGNNMFAYCNNNPVNYSDPSGRSVTDAFGGLCDIINSVAEIIERLVLTVAPRPLENQGDHFATYAGESDESVIARMLYGEDSKSAKAHMWVLQNRLDSELDYGGSNFRELTLSPNQFDAMGRDRALNPMALFKDPGEFAAWCDCVQVAYTYYEYGIDAIEKPYEGFDYTYTHAYCDEIVEAYPDGYPDGGTWFYFQEW